jgi:hypothetical protein
VRCLADAWLTLRALAAVVAQALVSTFITDEFDYGQSVSQSVSQFAFFPECSLGAHLRVLACDVCYVCCYAEVSPLLRTYEGIDSPDEWWYASCPCASVLLDSIELALGALCLTVLCWLRVQDVGAKYIPDAVLSDAGRRARAILSGLLFWSIWSVS